ncbi:MAG: redox-active protein [Lentisphaeria bacterium]|nr:redox-active protein [Lentisphaeria bacterium]
MKNTALTFFTAVPKQHNCAQAVAAGAGREALVPELAACGGGKAPGALCGALYALLLLAPESDHASLKEAFAAAAGAVTCREIKTGTLFPCTECVRLAAELSEKYL